MALPHPAVPSAPPRVLPFVRLFVFCVPSVKSLYLKLNPLLEVIGWDAGLGRSAALRGECNERATPPAGFFGRPAEGTGEAVFCKTKPR